MWIGVRLAGEGSGPEEWYNAEFIVFNFLKFWLIDPWIGAEEDKHKQVLTKDHERVMLARLLNNIHYILAKPHRKRVVPTSI